MSRIILRHIEFDLTPASIDNAIRQVRELREQLQAAMGELVRRLIDEGVQIARMQLVAMDCFDTELEGSIQGYYVPGWRMGWIYTDAPYAIFIEYGTGVVGQDSPHPGLGDSEWNTPVVNMNGKTYDRYDSQGHGERGWVFIGRDGQRHWTKGAVSKPFMYATYQWLMEAAEKRAGEMFNQM